MVARIKSCIGDDIDVLLDFHIEFQPKAPLTA